MRRSYELLIAEKLNQGGFFTHLSDAIDHMNQKLYSYCTYNKKQGYSFTIVTVVISESIFIVYNIDNVDEKVILLKSHNIFY